MEYASPVFHDSLTQYLSDDLESIQRRAMKIIFPGITYDEALSITNVQRLKTRRQKLSNKLFQERLYRLYGILPPRIIIISSIVVLFKSDTVYFSTNM
jgi:hypothetical protein